MNKKGIANILIIGIIVLILVAVGGVGYYFINQSLNKTACTMEAKICPDGTAVGRTGPNCEFAECPQANSNNSSFANPQMEKAITDYLLTQKYFNWDDKEGGHDVCVIKNLIPENQLFPLYVWAFCGEYVLENNSLKLDEASSLPVKIDYPNELSYYDLSKFSYEVPRDGSYNKGDTERIFPKEARDKMSSLDTQAIEKEAENISQEWFNTQAK